jgi:ABC-2 type transport system permease protein
MFSMTADRASAPRAWQPRLRKYASVARMAIQRELASRATLVARLALYGVLLLIFSKLWAVVAERSTSLPASSKDLLWYLAVTEWIVLSGPFVHLQIEKDVQNGNIAAYLPRPMSYLGARLAESAGELFLRAGVMAAGGFVFAWLVAGGLPDDPRGLFVALPLGIVAGLVVLAMHAAIGLTAVWLTDSAPLYWVWQKCAFILGGLMLPLEVYPQWLRGIALATPFPALLNGPGRMAFGWQPSLALQVVLQLLFWSIVAVAFLVWVYGRARRSLEVSGG